MGGRPWSQTDIERLKTLASLIPPDDLAKQLGRTRSSISAMMCVCGVQVREAAKRDGYERRDIERSLGVSASAVFKWVKSGRLNVCRRKFFRTHYLTFKHEDIVQFLWEGGALYPWLRPDPGWDEIVEDIRRTLHAQHISLTDLSATLHVTKSAICFWSRKRGFPKPILRLTSNGGSYYTIKEVRAWLLQHPERLTTQARQRLEIP